MSHANVDREGATLEQLEDFYEIMRPILSRLTPEQRLAGLTSDEIVLALPDEVLRNLRSEFLTSLKEETRQIIRRRLGLTAQEG